MTLRLSVFAATTEPVEENGVGRIFVLLFRLVFTKCWIHKLSRHFFVDISFISGLLFSFIASDVRLTTS
jgi:hypothetical protein